MTELIAEGEVKQTIGGILYIEQRQFTLGLGNRQSLIEVHELRMDGLHLAELDILHELTHEVTVRWNRGDGRLVDLLLQGIDTLTLEDSSIALGEETVSEIHDILFRELRHTLYTTGLLCPTLPVDKGFEMLTHTPTVVLQRTLVIEFQVVDDRRQQIVGEVAFLQVIDFA